MKYTIKLLVMLTVVTSISCNSYDTDPDPKSLISGPPNTYIIHRLLLSFQDTSGNDLVENISCDLLQFIREDGASSVNLRPTLYSLEYVYENINQDPWKQKIPAVIYDPIYPKISLHNGKWLNEEYPEVNSDYYYLDFYGSSLNSYYHYVWRDRNIKVPFAKKIIIKLKYPDLFGDDAIREIVTFWKPCGSSPVTYATCYRIEFNGKVFSVTQTKYDVFSVATIVLDR